MAYITSHDTVVGKRRGPAGRAPSEPSLAKGLLIAAPIALGLWACIIWSAAQIF